MTNRIIQTLLFCLISINSFSQNTVGISLNTENSLDGYTLFSPRTTLSPRYTYLINNCGEVVHKWNSDFELFSTDYLLPDGSLYRSLKDDQSTLNIPGNTGRIEHLDWDGNLLWGLTYSDTDFSFHHDYVILPSGNILMLVAHRKTMEEALQIGRDPSTLLVNELYEERVIEIEPIGTDSFDIVWEWRSWDHLIQDFDSTKDNYGIVGNHPELIDVNFGTSFGEADWWHSNALSYSSELDQIIISNRNFNEFIILDHSTSTAEAATNNGGNSNMGGDIIYRYGNPQTYRHGNEDDRKLFGQHNVQFIPQGLPNAGKILIFNNGLDVSFSRIQIITPPYDANEQNYIYNGSAYGPNNVDWQYMDPNEPTNFYAAFLSGAQQLHNGNVLICHGPNGQLFEIDIDGNIVWDYQSPVGANTILSDGDDPSLSQTRIFRALKYPSDYPAFDGRDLSPQGSIELNPVEDNCNLLSIDDRFKLDTLVKVYPKITSTSINIVTTITNLKSEIFTIHGKKITEAQNLKVLNLSNYTKGVYLLRISTNASSKTYKIIKN